MTNRVFIASIILFCLGWVFIYADRTALYPLLNVLATEFRISSTLTGFLTSSYFLVYVSLQIPAGIIGDYLGLKKLLSWTYLLAGLALLALGTLSRDYWSTFAFIILHGLGGSAYGAIAFGMSMKATPDRWRGLAAAAIYSGMSLGLILGLVSAGPLYSLSGNWRTPFIALAIPTIIVAILFRFFLPESPAVDGPKRFANPLKVCRHRNLLLLSLVHFCSLFGFWITVTWGPTFLQTERGFDISSSGLYLALIAIVALPAALAAGYLAAYVSRRKLGLVCFPITALAIIALANVQTRTAFLAVLVVYGLSGKFVWDPLGLSWAGEEASHRTPEHMGTAMGFYNFAGMASAFVAPLVSGWLRDVTGSLVPAFYLGAGLLLLAIPALYLLRETKWEC